jgi:hypothetical protein
MDGTLQMFLKESFGIVLLSHLLADADSPARLSP